MTDDEAGPGLVGKGKELAPNEVARSRRLSLPVSVGALLVPSDARLRKILIMGLPGAGKTTLARLLAPRLNAVWFNADEVRGNINRDLGFSHDDRIEHARRMGWLCDRVVDAGHTAIADFVCPTEETRLAFGPAFTVWVNRISEGRFSDTNKLFSPPQNCDLQVTAEGTPLIWIEKIISQRNTALRA